ncbi:MAG: NAD(P)-binding domain-containing protein, partial [Parafilimonas sp.]
MDVSIIGSGNVATVLGRLIIKAGHTITEVTSKNIAHAQALAKEINAKANDNISCLSKNSDIYLIAVSDNAIEEVCKQIILNDKIAVHTSGAISKDLLQHVSSFYGVLYPL